MCQIKSKFRWHLQWPHYSSQFWFFFLQITSKSQQPMFIHRKPKAIHATVSLSNLTLRHSTICFHTSKYNRTFPKYTCDRLKRVQIMQQYLWQIFLACYSSPLFFSVNHEPNLLVTTQGEDAAFPTLHLPCACVEPGHTCKMCSYRCMGRKHSPFSKLTLSWQLCHSELQIST